MPIATPERTFAAPAAGCPSALIDRFGRRVTYFRISVTDRCDFRCVYCMEPDQRFAPPTRS